MSDFPPSKIKSIDLIKAFQKDGADFSKIQQARNLRLENTKGLDPYTGDFGFQQKKHLLNRTMMGYAKRHYLDIEKLDLENSLNLIFSQQDFPANPINDYFYEFPKEKELSENKIAVEPYQDYSTIAEPNGSPWARQQSFEAWLYKNMIEQPTSIHWRMVYFLHSLLACSGGSVKLYFQHYKMLFNNAFNSYKIILKELTIDPMMLEYLNLQNSSRNAPDENYARELQELFAVGKGPNSKYTESDVVEMSKLLVGWRYKWESKTNDGPLVSMFEYNNHDTSDKHFSEFYGNRIILGRTGLDGMNELDEALDMILETQESSRYICRRLYQFFCFPEITDTVETNIIAPMAEIFRQNNYELAAPLRVLLASEHFYDAAFYSAMIKSPLDFVFNLKKTFQYKMVNYNDPTDIPARLRDEKTQGFYFYRPLSWAMGNQGQNFLSPPNVSGWPAFYQKPVYDLYWINSDSISKRAQHGNGFGDWGDYLCNGDRNGSVNLRIDPVPYINTITSPENLEILIKETIQHFSGVEVLPDTLNRLKYSVLQGANEQHYSDLIYNIKKGGSQDQINELTGTLTRLFKLVFQLAEVQLF